jgi:hypothetical protein
MRPGVSGIDLEPSASVRNVTTQDGAVLLDIDQGLCFSMNPVGARIWELLKLNSSVDFIADTLAGECSVPRELVLEDVKEFLLQLQKQNLLITSKERNKTSTSLLQRFFRRLAK